ncbi:16S rRNA (guanine(527)-N(7))-methyltransferase RsmG [Filimonas effusa]|uniref:Ribosomal RNA small subunit methyltransferase G n=1 Tax=Filimonas effusa TaxID=2508721 RepID=A0A4Q1DF46_9BACT|nr:16S rRNA (guanine(527)-N(7))-methyltransferase RsmG [Filimonas effusa]RXK87323.1 16S rRNA (guanine(527)-N(7))-methyltransferase RsmG [Filimonas effusa]
MDIVLKYFADFTEKQLQQFAALEGLYKEWNEQINVISRKDIDSLYLKHILHSLSIAAVIDFKPGTEVIDIGTGGGFPGIPLAIFFPEVKFHLADSIAKKLKVVQAVADAIELKNVTVQHTRAEEIKGRKFDFAVSRAVAPLKDLLQWSNPIVRRGNGQELPNGLICLKGGDLAAEISESRARPYTVPITQLFPEPDFEQKYLLHVTKEASGR